MERVSRSRCDSDSLRNDWSSSWRVAAIAMVVDSASVRAVTRPLLRRSLSSTTRLIKPVVCASATQMRWFKMSVPYARRTSIRLGRREGMPPPELSPRKQS